MGRTKKFTGLSCSMSSHVKPSIFTFSPSCSETVNKQTGTVLDSNPKSHRGMSWRAMATGWTRWPWTRTMWSVQGPTPMSLPNSKTCQRRRRQLGSATLKLLRNLAANMVTPWLGHDMPVWNHVTLVCTCTSSCLFWIFLDESLFNVLLLWNGLGSLLTCGRKGFRVLAYLASLCGNPEFFSMLEDKS